MIGAATIGTAGVEAARIDARWMRRGLCAYALLTVLGMLYLLVFHAGRRWG